MNIWNISPVAPRSMKAEATFDSLGDFIAATEAAQNSPANKEHNDADCRGRGRDWDDGVATLADWRSLMRIGWTEGARLAKEQSGRLAAQVTAAVTELAPRPVIAWGDEGDEVDVGRLNDGDDDHWIRQENEPARACGRVATLVVGGTVHAGVNSAAIQKSAVAIAAAIDALETAGVRVEVRLVHSITCSGNVSEIDVCLKRAEDPLDMTLLASGLHVCTFRRGAFRLWEAVPWDIGGGYGRPTEPSAKFKASGARVVSLIQLCRAAESGGSETWATELVKQLTTGEEA
jgi:hypothetical protein